MMDAIQFRVRCKRLTPAALGLFLSLVLGLGLGACGGGGGDAPSAGAAPGGGSAGTVAALPAPVAGNVPAAATVAPATAAPTAPPTAPSAVGNAAVDLSCGLNGAAGIQAEILQRVNAVRAAGAVCGTTAFQPASALAWNEPLLVAAGAHSADMAQKNYFSHVSQDGRTAAQRVTAAGYSWSSFGENIAAGQSSVEQVMTGWINSPGHCQNLMNLNFRDVAVACVRNDAADYRLYWTMNLGRGR